MPSLHALYLLVLTLVGPQNIGIGPTIQDASGQIIQGLHPSAATRYAQQAQKKRQQLQDLALHVHNPQAWGQAKNQKSLQDSAMLGYIGTEAVTWVFGGEIIKGFTTAAKAGKATLLSTRLLKAGATSKELGQLTGIANLPKARQRIALARFMAKNPKLEAALAQVGGIVTKTKTPKLLPQYTSVERLIPLVGAQLRLFKGIKRPII